jgi:hypothetical protein
MKGGAKKVMPSYPLYIPFIMTISEDKALQAVFQAADVEVDEEALLYRSEPHIGEQLRFVDGHQFLHRFQFKDDFVGNEDIHTIATIYSHAFVFDGQRVLRNEPDIIQRQLARETVFVSGFEQSRPKHAMHLNGAANHSL